MESKVATIGTFPIFSCKAVSTVIQYLNAVSAITVTLDAFFVIFQLRPRSGEHIGQAKAPIV